MLIFSFLVSLTCIFMYYRMGWLPHSIDISSYSPAVNTARTLSILPMVVYLLALPVAMTCIGFLSFSGKPHPPHGEKHPTIYVVIMVSIWTSAMIVQVPPSPTALEDQNIFLQSLMVMTFITAATATIRLMLPVPADN